MSSVPSFVRRHGDVFWWLHSLWALLFGVGVMWVGSRRYGLLRVAVFQIAFIWIASLIVPALVSGSADSSRWAAPARLVINYFSRNFYQQLLFFLLPIYWASSSFSWNLLFVVFLAVSALLATLDVVYDRYLSVRRGVMAVFFAFNLFACINVMLPVLWSIGNTAAMRLSAALALLAFASVIFGRKQVGWRTTAPLIAVSGLVLFATIEFARPLVPPAPLRIASATFGLDVDRGMLRITDPVDRLNSGWSGRLFVLTAISAPMGLEERVRHRWYNNGRLVWSSPFHQLRGGRKEGFRLWTSVLLRSPATGRVRVDVETEGGQLIGRREIAVEAAPSPRQAARMSLDDGRIQDSGIGIQERRKGASVLNPES